MDKDQAGIIDDLTRASVLELKVGFDELWLRKLSGLEVETATREELEPALLEVATGIDLLFRQMAGERDRVVVTHPWQFGGLLVWLMEPVGETLGRSPITRFDLLQKAGYWSDREFKEWAASATGVGYSTWSGWTHAVKTFLMSPAGDLVLEMAEVGKEEFVRMIPMGKAQRAVARVASGQIERHQIEALVNPNVTETQMRHVLRSTQEEWEHDLEEQAKRDEEWVAHVGPKSWIDFSPLDGRVVLKQVDSDGVFSENLICRMPLAAQPMVELLQNAMLVAAEKTLDGLEFGSPGVAEEFIVLVAEGAEEGVQ